VIKYAGVLKKCPYDDTFPLKLSLHHSFSCITADYSSRELLKKVIIDSRGTYMVNLISFTNSIEENLYGQYAGEN
jgi:hypothetical protein